MVNGAPDPFLDGAVAALRRVTAEYEAGDRASVVLESELPGVIEVVITPTASTAAPLRVEVESFGDLNVLVGAVGFLIEVAGASPEENLAEATSIVEGVMATGCRMWLAPRPAGDDPRGILELEAAGEMMRALDDATPLAVPVGKRRWRHHSYTGY